MARRLTTNVSAIDGLNAGTALRPPVVLVEFEALAGVSVLASETIFVMVGSPCTSIPGGVIQLCG